MSCIQLQCEAFSNYNKVAFVSTVSAHRFSGVLVSFPLVLCIRVDFDLLDCLPVFIDC